MTTPESESAACRLCGAPKAEGTPFIVDRRANICRPCVVDGMAQVAHAAAEAANGAADPAGPPATCLYCERDWPAARMVVRNGAAVCGSCLAHCTKALLDQEEKAGRASPKGLERPRGARYAVQLLQEHFDETRPEEIVTAVRRFPARVRADLQGAIERLFTEHPPLTVVGLHQRYQRDSLGFPELWQEGNHAVMVGPLQHIEVDIGEAQPVRCLRNTLWLLEAEGLRHAVVLSELVDYMERSNNIQVEVAVLPGPAGQALTARYFEALERAVAEAGSYRGKVLSLESARSYSGQSSGIQVHKLRPVGRDEIILPDSTLALLERNVFDFFAQRDGLAALDMPVKKGLLFYGPPGTGKTHSIHYLAARLEGHTTLLVTAEQMGLLKEYVALARLLQPSILVLEDADLIARQREMMGGPCEESLLNQLLNEMDGLREQAEILFILTTNRPETLESALASRPGRVDQAIEFPLPDAAGRRRLARLYARNLEVPDPVMATVVARTEKASAAFIKELMRRAAQFCLARGGEAALAPEDLSQALDELLVSGGRLNASLLGIEVEGGHA